MNSTELEHGINKALEVWSLQGLCDLAIMLTFLILALVAGRAYLESMRNRLTLRVTAEVLDMGTDLLIDVLLGFVSLAGLFLINPDIMCDIKIALPWVPLAMVLTTAALVVRVWHGGRHPGSSAWWIVFALLATACAANWFGFTFVMEAAGEEYLKPNEPSVWLLLQRMRSDFNPSLAMITFLWANPAIVLILAWGVVVGATRSSRCRPKGKVARMESLVPTNES